MIEVGSAFICFVYYVVILIAGIFCFAICDIKDIKKVKSKIILFFLGISAFILFLFTLPGAESFYDFLVKFFFKFYRL